jgi:hypothetical protein
MITKEIKIMKTFDDLNRETFNYNNGITRNIDPTSNIKHPTDFNRLNRDTYCHNNKIKASELAGRFNSCYR